MTLDSKLSWVVPCIALLGITGCSSGDAGNPELRRSAEESQQQGIELVEQGDYQGAYDELSTAITGGLNADLYSEALVYHAVAATHLGKFEEAQKNFETLEQGATNLDEVFAAQSFFHLKQGNQSEAKKYWNQARRINPRVKKFGS